MRTLSIAFVAAILYTPVTTGAQDMPVMYFGPSQALTLTIRTNGDPSVVLNVPPGLQLEIHADRQPSTAELPILYRGNILVRARRFIPVTTNHLSRIDIGEYNFTLALRDAEVEIAVADPIH